MIGPEMNVRDWKRRLTAELKRDKKKTAVLALLVTVVAGIVGVRVLFNRPSPAKAGGAAAVTAKRAKALNDSGTVPQPQVIRTGRKFRPGRFVRSTKRDMFALNPDFFPPQSSSTEAKLLTTTAPGQTDRETERRLIQAHAQALVLQSTVVSADPTAIINGRVLQVGDWISGFKVIEITSHTCTIEKNNVKVILEMKN